MKTQVDLWIVANGLRWGNGVMEMQMGIHDAVKTSSISGYVQTDMLGTKSSFTDNVDYIS